jgi:hypothetical protein
VALGPYVKVKFSLKEFFPSLGLLILRYRREEASILFFVLLSFLLWHKSTETIRKLNEIIITASSILTAVVITYLAAKIIAFRQEKLSLWDNYHALTPKVHHFRAAVFQLYFSWQFWPNGLKTKMEGKYKILSWYDVRKIVFVHGTETSPLAQEFIREEGGLANLYLQLRSFFLPSGIMDNTIFSSGFDVPIYYELGQLELWHSFDCGSELWYCFKDKWLNYQHQVNFNGITHYHQQDIKDHCERIDRERYRDIPVGHELYDQLGQQFTGDLLPRLITLSRRINGPIPAPIRFLSWILTTMILVGIVVPILVAINFLSPSFAILGSSAIMAFLLYIALAFSRILATEAEIVQTKWSEDEL